MSSNIESVAAAAREHFEYLVRTALKPCERLICRDADFEDRKQEGLGRTWEWYAGQVAAGSMPDTALVVHACSLAMRNRDRTVVGHEHRPRHDVYDRQGHDLELRRLGGVHDYDDEEHHDEDPGLGLARLGLNNPEPHLLSAMDLESWLHSLSDRDRETLEMRGAGYGLNEISATTKTSVAGVFRRARQLGYQLAERAEIELPMGRGRRGTAGSSNVRG